MKYRALPLRKIRGRRRRPMKGGMEAQKRRQMIKTGLNRKQAQANLLMSMQKRALNKERKTKRMVQQFKAAKKRSK